jgi:regulator of RNase E activity RraA
MGDIKNDILEYIRRNRVSTTEVADCLGKTGCLEDILPINQGKFCAGFVTYAYAVNESNWTIHEAVTGNIKDKIVFMDAIDTNGRAMVGELVSKYILLYQGAVAIVTNGKMRDAHKLIKERYPIWSKGVTPIGTFNIETDVTNFQEIIDANRELYEDALMVCDDSGVVLIEKKFLNKEFYDKLEFIEEQEDIWFDCLDRRKWSTFDIVCKKRYRL